MSLWTFLALATFSAVSPAATDEERAAARALAEQGAQAFKKDEYQRAVDLFTRAEALIHSPVHLLFLARSHRELGELVKARESYIKITRERLAADAPKVFFRAQKEASEELDAIEPRLASLTVVIEGAPPENVRLTLDDETVPAVLIGVPMPVDPGTHQLVASTPGAEDQSATVTLNEGQTDRLNFTLEVTEPLPAGDPPVGGDHPGNPPSEGGSKALAVVGWTAVGLGAVGLGIGTYLWADSSALQSEADREAADCGRFCPDDEAAVILKKDTDAADEGTTAAIVGAISGATLITGVVLLLVDSGGSPETSGSLTPMVGPAWVGMSGRF